MRVRVVTVLLAAIALAASGSQSFLEQGRAALNHGDAARAAELLEKAIEQTPNNSEAHTALAEAYGNLARKASLFSELRLAKKAQAELERAVQLDPNNLHARMGLVEFYTEAPSIAGGSDAEAARQANDLRKRDALYGHRAWAYIYTHQKKPELARKEYVEFVREQPQSPVAHYWLGVQDLIDRNYKDATEEFENAVKVDPGYMPGWFQIGHMAALTGADLARGEGALHKYLAYSPKDEEPPIARAHYWLGAIYEKQGKKAEARRSYELSLRLNATQRDVQEALRRVS